MSNSPFYTGRGARDPGRADALPAVDLKSARDPEGYRATPRLAAAVDVALTLGMPLLLTGEPGSGKSGLAHSLAWELGLGEVLRFPVKSDTESRDLFYRFDTVGRFHAAQSTRDDAAADPARFITFEALGQAILLAQPAAAVQELRLPPDHAFRHPGTPRRSVVLIDEIDKAPRDVPNDILVEIELMQFKVPELCAAGRPLVQVALTDDECRYRPIIIFTSNSEKALPDPFLRRCVYHHLGFPPFDAQLLKNGAQQPLPEARVTVDTIVAARLGRRYLEHDQARARVADALDFFGYLRSDRLTLERRPTLAELLNWLDCLMPRRALPSAWTALAALRAPADPPADPAAADRLVASIASLLLKKPADQERAGQLLNDWRGQKIDRR
jgi:MoxR-like ATPase